MRKFPHGRVVWLTGASSGIGAAAMAALSEAGYKVYGTSRSGQGKNMLRMDVRDEQSVASARDAILRAEGRIDIVINCAGVGIAGPVENTSPEEAEAQFDTNVWGVMRVVGAALPVMRAQKSGLVVNVGSIAGLVPLPFQGLYSASKYALEAITGCLRQELRPFGVRVTMVEPGDCRTGFTAARRGVEHLDEAYRQDYQYALAQMVKDEEGGMDPRILAKCILRVVRRKNPAFHNYCGLKYHALMVLVKLCPARLMEKALRWMYLPPKKGRA